MAKIKAEVIEEGGIKVASGQYECGEIVIADSDKNPQKYQDMVVAVNHGWAKDADTGETGERKPGTVKLNVDPVVQPAKAQVK